MLRKIAYNKIFRTSVMLLLFLLLLLFPVSKEYSLEDTNKKVRNVISDNQNEVYLLDKNDYVSRCKINLNNQDNKNYAKMLIELLIIDGKYSDKIPNGFKAALPSTLIINSVNINKDVITLDFSEDFYELKGKYIQKAIELITYNLTTIKEIKYIYININGKKLKHFPSSNEVFNQPFKRSDGVNKKYEQTSYNNVSKTTIYYLGKQKDSYYYIPVTKINNDNRDKIKIIIDELSSASTYESNLISLLNYNSKLKNYDIDDKVFSLNFNKYLFDDFTSSNILEEVIYSISLSIRENYDVDEVIFNVNNKEITKTVLKDIE